MKKQLLFLATTVVAIGGVTSAALSGGSVSERRAKALAAYEPVGEAISCVTLSQVRSSKVIDDRTIDFKMSNGKVYRNTLPHSCPGLASEERFSHHTSLNQLCSVDTIRVLQSFGSGLHEGAGCGLGKFQPMQKVQLR
ncbi:MAG: hypothetical protein IPG54_03370 [Sphingomonadales bacterium]|jgi:hypothetical protein|nr:hypothetical protein [Sphingomonadales bacterium]MBK9003190.1 hypothetical protein [Sphingomonadales bacterium]MBK9268438.1 hypothetical protein [Sphingomonadales bacterium]